MLEGLALAIQQLHTRYVAEHALTREWTSCTRGITCPTQSRAPARARSLVDRLRDSWQHLLRDRATRSLTYNDEQFHVLERIKVSLLFLCLTYFSSHNLILMMDYVQAVIGYMTVIEMWEFSYWENICREI